MAKAQLDILLTQDYDLLIADGDLVVGEATRQHQQLILLNDLGQIDIAPLCGVGVMGWLLNDEADTDTLRHAIGQQFKADGLVIRKLDLSNLPTIKLAAAYE